MREGLEICGLERAGELGRGKKVHLAIGVFDAVHRGHQLVIGEAVRAAKEDGGVAVVLTFSPHPSRVFRPENPSLLIVPHELRVRMLFEMGVEAVITQGFDRSFAELEASGFVPMLKENVPGLESLHIGDNWLFGKGRTGTAAFLAEECHRHGLRLFRAAYLNEGKFPVSSTRIRECLQAGDIEQVNRLLGYKYFSEGQVIGGKQIGRKLGFPTLNVNWEVEQRPLFGVYAVRVLCGGVEVPAVANYGLRPTVEGEGATPLLEVHVLGDCAIEGGAEVKVEWECFVRGERKFSGLEELKSQIALDVVRAREWFRLK